MHRNNNAMDGDWAQLVRAEYLEIPGLNLTRDEAQRLWGLDREACEQLLAALVERRFLKRTRDNRYLRVDGSSMSRRPGARDRLPLKPVHRAAVPRLARARVETRGAGIANAPTASSMLCV